MSTTVIKEYAGTRHSGGETFGWACRNCGKTWFQSHLFTWRPLKGRVWVVKADRKSEAVLAAEAHECVPRTLMQ